MEQRQDVENVEQLVRRPEGVEYVSASRCRRENVHDNDDDDEEYSGETCTHGKCRMTATSVMRVR